MYPRPAHAAINYACAARSTDNHHPSAGRHSQPHTAFFRDGDDDETPTPQRLGYAAPRVSTVPAYRFWPTAPAV